MLYLWVTPESVTQKCIGVYDQKLSPDYFLLKKGRKLSLTEFNKVPIVQVDVSQKRILSFDCIPNSTAVPLVNKSVKLMLEQLAPEDVQFFKARVLCKDGELDNYFFLNATSMIQGIDHARSSYTKMCTVDKISGFQSLTYLPNCMGPHYLARDIEYCTHLLVTEEVKKLFDREKVTGVRLVRPEDYYGPFREI